MDIKLYRNPGLYYDLYNILVKKLNIRGKWLHLAANAGHENEDIRYIEKYMAMFPDPPIELKPFFYKKDRIARSYFSFVYCNLLEEYGENIDLNCFIEYMADIDRLKKELCIFYLGSGVDYQNLKQISAEIEKVPLKSEEVRFHLLCFFARPEYYSELLIRQFKEYDAILPYEFIESVYDKYNLREVYNLVFFERDSQYITNKIKPLVATDAMVYDVQNNKTFFIEEMQLRKQHVNIGDDVMFSYDGFNRILMQYVYRISSMKKEGTEIEVDVEQQEEMNPEMEQNILKKFKED